MALNKHHAPIAVFAYKRASHTLRALEALAGNAEWEESPLFIYCDGARRNADEPAVEATRAVVRAFAHPRKTIIEAPASQGLARSIIGGVADLTSRFGQVIVVEDDLIVSPVFLAYMNHALERYRDDTRVMQISGHMFPVNLDAFGNAVFLPFTTTWGWATWARAWTRELQQPELALKCLTTYAWRKRFDLEGAYPYARLLVDQMRGRKDSWGIWWYFHVFHQNGLTLYPTRTLVRNEGFDGTGTHRGTGGDSNSGTLHLRHVTHLPEVAESKDATGVIRDHIRAGRGLPRRVKDDWKRAFPGRLA